MGRMNAQLNRLQWRGGRGHYEVYYLTLHDPASGWAFWFRYTLEAPSDGGRPQAYLWAFSFPPAGEEAGLSLQLLDRHPIGRLHDRSRRGRFALELGPGWLDAEEARGSVGAGARRIAWDLRLGPSWGSYRHVSPRLYGLRVASSAVATPALAMAATGWVQVGERRIELKEALAEQGHVYGRRHADRWTWAHCHAFSDAPGLVFEGVSAQVEKLGLLLPPASPLLVRQRGPQGVDLSWSGPRAMWTPTSQFGLGYWTFEAQRGDRLLRGSLSAPLESFVRVEYRDPDGSSVWCNHSEVAEVRLELLARDGDGWRPEWRRVGAPAAFEYGDRAADPRPPRRLDQAEARPA